MPAVSRGSAGSPINVSTAQGSAISVTDEVFESQARLVAAEVARVEAREAALRQLATLQTPLEASRTPVDGFNPVDGPDTPDHVSTSVEAQGESIPDRSPWQTEDLETQARLERLREQLSNGEK